MHFFWRRKALQDKENALHEKLVKPSPDLMGRLNTHTSQKQYMRQRATGEAMQAAWPLLLLAS